MPGRPQARSSAPWAPPPGKRIRGFGPWTLKCTEPLSWAMASGWHSAHRAVDRLRSTSASGTRLPRICLPRRMYSPRVASYWMYWPWFPAPAAAPGEPFEPPPEPGPFCAPQAAPMTTAAAAANTRPFDRVDGCVTVGSSRLCVPGSVWTCLARWSRSSPPRPPARSDAACASALAYLPQASNAKAISPLASGPAMHQGFRDFCELFH